MSSFSAYAATICTMSFNSIDEKKVMKKFYSSPSDLHVELIPNSKDPNWFSNACNSGVKCDVLLLSGHFGGMFFGEKSSSTLSLDEIEKASCQRTCGNILNAKQVYLMGCNTLATKKPDHRSIEKYLSVLVQDGFPRNLAEEVVASRYVNYGLGISERMSIAFRNSKELFGFSSTGPLGVHAAPKLQKALYGSSSLSLSSRLRGAFAGTSFRVVNPNSEISGHDFDLQCGTRSIDEPTKIDSYGKILSATDVRRHFDLILRNINDTAVAESLRSVQGSSPLKEKIIKLSQDIFAHSQVLIGARFQVMKLLKLAGIVDKETYIQKINSSLNERLASGLDPIKLDQVCSIAQNDRSLIFKTRWLTNASSSEHSYWARLYGCFKIHENGAEEKLKNILASTADSSARREIIRSLKDNFSSKDRADLLSDSKSWSSRDRYELMISLGIESQSQCNTRDEGLAWNCFEKSKSGFKNLAECQATTNTFYTETGLGADWYCLQQFPQEIHLSACIKAGAKYKNAEKADDFLQYCWDQLRTNKLVNRSECMGFGQAMRIQGNKIKQNWNCMNQI